MEKFEIPKRNQKRKMLIIPVTKEEHETIMQFCKEQNSKLTLVVRHAIKQTYNLNSF